ncbi:MAG TPA: O-antigen ligase family protein [Devosiaceae bacterium]|nr:O-antigen ligase family protein [Devosiaceae bacterium]
MRELVETKAPAILAVTLLALTLTTPYLLGAPGAYLQIVCAVLALAMLVSRRDALQIGGDPTYRLLLIALAILIAAFAATAHQPREAIFGLNFAMLLLFGPLAAFLGRFAAPGNTIRVAGFALVGAALALALALFQVLVMHMDRAAGWGSDPIWSAEAALILGFIAVIGLRSQHRWRVLFALGPVLGTAACLLAGSRGPLVALPAMLLVAMLFASRRWWLVPLLAAIAAIAAFLVLKVAFPASIDRFGSLIGIGQDLATGKTIAEVSAGTRQAFYAAGYQAFLHAPWIGYGWQEKMQAIVPYLPGDGAALIAPHRHLHSDVLDFGVAGGIAGLIAYALIIAAPLVGAIKAPRDGQYVARLMGAGLLAAGYFFCGLTYLMFGYEFLTELYVCLAAVLIGYCRDVPPLAASERPRGAAGAVSG